MVLELEIDRVGQFAQGARVAFWFWFAVVLTYLYQQGMVFVKQLNVLLQV